MAHPPVRKTLALALAAGACGVVAPRAVRAEAPPPCTRYASLSGSDTAPGTQAAPVRSVARLITLLGPGQQGCLPAGSTFVEPIGSFIVDGAGGAPGSPAVVRTDDPDGAPAQIKGAMWLKPGVHDLTFDRVRFTDSPGNNSKGTMLVVHGDRITFRRTEMTWSRGICLNAGNREGYVAGDTDATVAAEDLVIEQSRIHDCGTDPGVIDSLRSAGQSGVHGLYLVDAPRAIIRDNLIYDNIDRGVQLWPDVDDAVIEHNVLDGNGSNLNIGSSAPYGHYSERTTVRDNVISNAVLRSVTDQPWGPGDTESVVGNFPQDGSTHGNALTGNCVFQSVAGARFGGQGYDHTGDILGDPRYVDRTAHDFTLRDDSPCLGKGPRFAVLDIPGTPSTRPDAQPADPVAPAPALAALAGAGIDALEAVDGEVDTTPPVLGVRLLRGAQLIVCASERSTLLLRVARRSGRRWKTVAAVRRTVARGRTRVSLPAVARRGAKHRGRYRLTVQATDAAGNRSAPVVLTLR